MRLSDKDVGPNSRKRHRDTKAKKRLLSAILLQLTMYKAVHGALSRVSGSAAASGRTLSLNRSTVEPSNHRKGSPIQTRPPIDFSPLVICSGAGEEGTERGGEPLSCVLQSCCQNAAEKIMDLL